MHTSINTLTLDASEILCAYDAVSGLYPYTPSLSHWRAWECAAYRKFRLGGRILDLGCGDGRYFHLVWPGAIEVVGVDMNPTAAELGRQSGVYRQVHVTPAHRVPEKDGSFDHVFANCSLEHMDELDAVLAEICRCLTRGGSLLCSVVTNRFVDWTLLPNLMDMAGFSGAAEALQNDFLRYHHLANPLSVESWREKFSQAGLHVEVHIPILPKYNSGIFLLIDMLWHVKKKGEGKLGDTMGRFLAGNDRFPAAFRNVLAALLEMETDWSDCSGAVFFVRGPL